MIFDINDMGMERMTYPHLASLPVELPYTEATADANTFVCEFTGGAASNETGVGLGLTGLDIVLTQVGSIGAASSGWRSIANVNQYFTWKPAISSATINTSEFTLMHKIRNIATTAARYIWYIGTTGQYSVDVAKTGYLNLVFNDATHPNRSFSPTAQFNNTTPYWVAMWKKNGILHFGYVDASSGVPPTGWDSFPPNQRAAISGVADISETWSATGSIVGFTGASCIMDIGLVIASKIGLASAPI